jgi:hypothetical protein
MIGRVGSRKPEVCIEKLTFSTFGLLSNDKYQNI